MLTTTIKHVNFVLLLSICTLLTACPLKDKHSGSNSNLHVVQNGIHIAADFSCLGERDAPESGDFLDMSIPAVAFGQVDAQGNPILIPNLEIQVFWDNIIPKGKECDNCTLASSDEGGYYTFSAPSGQWLSYRVIEKPKSDLEPAILRTSEVNFEPSPTEAFNVMFEPVLSGLHQNLGIPRLEDRSLVAGRLIDCNGDLVQGATVSLLDAKGEPISEGSGAVTIYLDQNGPNPSLWETSSTGQWSVSNVPYNGSDAYVEMRDKNGLLVACELISLSKNGYSVVVARPLRLDSFAMCTP